MEGYICSSSQRRSESNLYVSHCEPFTCAVNEHIVNKRSHFDDVFLSESNLWLLSCQKLIEGGRPSGEASRGHRYCHHENCPTHENVSLIPRPSILRFRWKQSVVAVAAWRSSKYFYEVGAVGGWSWPYSCLPYYRPLLRRQNLYRGCSPDTNAVQSLCRYRLQAPIIVEDINNPKICFIFFFVFGF